MRISGGTEIGDQVYFRGEQAGAIVADILDNLATHPIRSAAAFRNAVLSPKNIFAINPLLKLPDDPYSLADETRQHLKQIVAEGRMIDFGFVPNEVIKAESIRSRDLFEAGELMQPFGSEGWLGVMAWEGGMNGYMVVPWGSAILVRELYGVALPDHGAVILYDMMVIRVVGPGDTQVTPAPVYDDLVDGMRRLSGMALDPGKRGANSLDPLVLMLRLLADASVPVDRQEAPAKLNKARARQGKHAIPAHHVVRTSDYVAHFSARAERRTAGDGTGRHAPPAAHWRRAHMRHLADDRIVKVRSSRVNWRSDEELHRLFYSVDQKR